jgi:hypothetical protein
MKFNLILYFLLCLFVFNSCNKKNVQLPIIDIEGIREIQNHSSIWIFYEVNEKDTLAILNKNNKLINTSWIFNIDKRLTMEKIIPSLEKMQEYRNKDSMHKKEGMLNYFSYADISSNNNSLVKFDATTYGFIEKNKLENYPVDKKERLIELVIRNDKLIVDHLEIHSRKLAQKLSDIAAQDTLSKQKIILKYPSNLTYQNYLTVKLILSKVSIEVDTNEYIYTLK